MDTPEEKTYVPWDPTMHNTSSYDRPIQPGQRVMVKSCGFVYVGGSVGKPGAYASCSSPVVRLSQIISLAGGLGASTSANHTIISRPNPDGSRTIYQIRLDKVLRGDAQDPLRARGRHRFRAAQLLEGYPEAAARLRLRVGQYSAVHLPLGSDRSARPGGSRSCVSFP